jgi:hypothetical protein
MRTVVRVEELWRDTAGNAFVTGHEYLPPRATFHLATQLFFPSEVIEGSIVTYPLKSCVGFCAVLPLYAYRLGA